MQLRLLAVLSASLVALSGAAAWSDGMPAQSHHVAKKKVVRHRAHVHTPNCPPGEDDDSWAVADQLNHDEWLRHRQQDLGHRTWRSGQADEGGWDQADLDDGFSDGPPPPLESRYGPPPTPRGHSHFERRAEHWRDSHGAGYVVGQRDGRAYGHAWGDADRDGPDHAGPAGKFRRYSSQDRAYDGAAWADRGDYADDDAYDRDDDVRADRREEARGGYAREARRADFGQRRVIVRRQVETGGERYSGGYAEGYGEGYGHGGYASGERGYGRGGAYVGRGFYYETGASYAGRDAYGYLTWPGKTPG